MPSMFRQPFDYWSILVGGRQASPLECYSAIEKAIQRREIPGVKISRVTFKEGGFLSAERIYLRVCRKRLGFDICAAPCGTGFLFSWRLGKLPPSNFLGCFALLLVGWVIGSVLYLLVEFRQTAEAPVSEFLALGLLLFFTSWVVGKAVRKRSLLSEDAILNMPLIGSLYNLIFHPPTYYKLDMIESFQKAVHAAVLEVIDDMRSAKGLRALAPPPPRFVFPSTPGLDNPLIRHTLTRTEETGLLPWRRPETVF